MVSIIIPTLNEEEYLPLLLDSLGRQDFEDEVEVIVADADSTDRTRDIANSFDCRVVRGGLPSVGRNRGAAVAKGEYFLFLDADLVLPENFLSDSLRELKRRELAIASYCLYPETAGWTVKVYFNLFYNWPIKACQNFLPHAAMAILVKRDVFNKVGGFDEEIKLAEDHYFARQAAKFEKFGIIRSARPKINLRRFEKDGYLTTSLKYFFCSLYMLSGKPVKSDIFNYRFGHYKDLKDK